MTVPMTNEMKLTIANLSGEQLQSVGLMRIYDASEPPEIKIYPEVACAAKWWASQLKSTPLQDNGDLMQTMLATIAAGREIPLQNELVDRFERWLAFSLQWRFTHKQWPGDGSPSWRRIEPNFGSFNRTIYNDYGPDEWLIVAAKLAGIPGRLSNRFPIKTCMWINPGEVKVRLGYGSEEKVIYSK